MSLLSTEYDEEVEKSSYAHAVRDTVNYCIENGILADFLKENGGKVVSSLFAEYDEEVAKRVYAEECVEDRIEELAMEMLQDGEQIEKIVKYTKLPMSTVERLRKFAT